MAPFLFNLTAGLFWLFFAVRLVLWRKPHARLDSLTTAGEKLGYILFTIGLSIYIYYYQERQDSWLVQSLSFKKPVSWLLFTWSIYSCQILVEIFYNFRLTVIFSNAWIAAALTLLPNSTPDKIHTLFPSSAEWLSLHRLAFLLAYSFCFLAVPLSIIYLWQHARVARLPEEQQILEERQLWMLDRQQYRMILWALPLLSMGIVAESLILMRQGNFPSPIELWTVRRESFLALATWFCCGIYLHTRLFFAWRDVRSSVLYLTAFALILAANLSQHFLHFR